MIVKVRMNSAVVTMIMILLWSMMLTLDTLTIIRLMLLMMLLLGNQSLVSMSNGSIYTWCLQSKIYLYINLLIITKCLKNYESIFSTAQFKFQIFKSIIMIMMIILVTSIS